MLRSRQIAEKAGFMSPTVYWFRWVQHSPQDWALELSPGEEGHLSPEECSRLVAIHIKPIQVHPTPVYRYMAEEYVDEFFRTGKLQLSSFIRFAKHPDERFRDEKEGWNILGVTGKDSTMYTVTAHGRACLVLSTSLLGPWSEVPQFHRHKSIEIINPLAFAGAIAASITSCTKSIVGTCSYVERRVTRMHVPDRDFTKLDPSGGIQSVVGEAASLLQYTPMFQKPQKHAVEQEYRFVWELNLEAPEVLFVECPEARELCRPAT